MPSLDCLPGSYPTDIASSNLPSGLSDPDSMMPALLPPAHLYTPSHSGSVDIAPQIQASAQSSAPALPCLPLSSVPRATDSDLSQTAHTSASLPTLPFTTGTQITPCPETPLT